ncbi:DUF1127 domain-containing protein [Paracoccus sp. YLB-12]|uniref:DUF1127 domain-containing protein n=1 Tax=Paracoccus maritimus TaxID=2933292 RepID=A0ABT2KDM0_9RHOB|nr:DUF1127 domain-containing protein [Paracoccus sp. YLB-12]MCT4333935.1 DUF1127 domain-containing protein [Paracoccus sp. YLB-12]
MTTIALNEGFGLKEFFADLRADFADWLKRRETRAELNRLSERELEDIGLNRADIDGVVASI